MLTVELNFPTKHQLRDFCDIFGASGTFTVPSWSPGLCGAGASGSATPRTPFLGAEEMAFRIEYYANQTRVMVVSCPKTIEEAIKDATAGLGKFGAE